MNVELNIFVSWIEKKKKMINKYVAIKNKLEWYNGKKMSQVSYMSDGAWAFANFLAGELCIYQLIWQPHKTLHENVIHKFLQSLLPHHYYIS